MEENNSMLTAEQYNELYCKAFARLDDVVRLAVQAMQEPEELPLAMGECPPPAQSGSESGKT